MSDVNKYGLKRYIPADIKRKVRRNSKFGCVICRSGFIQYEHFDPAFEDANQHSENGICCLCGSCHDQVTRGHLSKDLVKKSYNEIRDTHVDDIKSPTGPLDFHTGKAELLIGGLLYSPMVKNILKYHGDTLISLNPGSKRKPGEITAIFTDKDGKVILKLIKNEWIGSLVNWDIEVSGQRITVRRKKGEISLKIRLDPPGRVVIERLDMRYENCHLLVTESTYAVGRYIKGNIVRWANVEINIQKSSKDGSVFEFLDNDMIEIIDFIYKDFGTELATNDRRVVMSGSAGVILKDLGIIIGSFSGSYDLLGVAVHGDICVDDMRDVIFNRPHDLYSYLND